MNNKHFYLSIVFSVFAVLFFAASAQATVVSGELRGDTVWTASNSPYEIYRAIEIPRGKTLTIEPGVEVVSRIDSINMFILKGRLVAEGTADNMVVFDGNGTSDFLDAAGSTAPAEAIFKYCHIKNGVKFWDNGMAAFSLENSILEDWSAASYVYYPHSDVNISNNTFKNSAGFSVGLSGEVNFDFSNNYWVGKRADAPAYEDYFINNWAAFDSAEVIVEKNTFSIEDGIILRYDTLANPLAMNAENNYWGTLDSGLISASIYDNIDNAAIAGAISFEPFLDAPDPATPGSEIQNDTDDSADTGSSTPDTDPSQTDDNADDSSGEAVGYCQTFNYGQWSACEGGKQMRVIASKSPENCEAQNPVLEQSCTSQAPEPAVIDKALSARLAGRILLAVESNGEAWYVNPADQKRYYLGRPADAFALMRRFGLGAKHEYISKNQVFPASVRGKILLDVESHGEAYYIDPVSGQKQYLGRPLDAFNLMRKMGLGISNANLAKIAVGD